MAEHTKEQQDIRTQISDLLEWATVWCTWGTLRTTLFTLQMEGVSHAYGLFLLTTKDLDIKFAVLTPKPGAGKELFDFSTLYFHSDGKFGCRQDTMQWEDGSQQEVYPTCRFSLSQLVKEESTFNTEGLARTLALLQHVYDICCGKEFTYHERWSQSLVSGSLAAEHLAEIENLREIVQQTVFQTQQ